MANPERPDKLIAQRVASQIPALTIGRNLYCGPPEAAGKGVPNDAVFIWIDGGPSPLPCMGQELTQLLSNLSVRVRNRKYDDGLDLARAVRDAIHYAPLTGYLDSLVLQSEPIWIGEDDTRHHEWSMSIEASSEYIFDDANDPRLPDLP